MENGLKPISLIQTLKRNIGENWPLALFAAAHIVIFLVIFQGLFFGYASKDNSINEYLYASKIHFGQWPYRDFAVEYPPLSMLFIALPGLASTTYFSYLSAYIVEMLIFDLLGLVVISAVANEMRLSRWKPLAFYTVAVLAIGPLVTVRFDIIPAVITLLGLYALIKGHSKVAWALLAAGVFTKIYPVVLIPVFLIYQLHQQQKRQLFTSLAAFATVSLIILAPPSILSPSGLWHSFTYHMQRGLQIESTYASFLELMHGFDLIPLNISREFGSVNVSSPLADFLGQISFGIMLLSLLAAYWFFHQKLKNAHEQEHNFSLPRPDVALLFNFSVFSILIFLLTSKVFSPQYLIWLLPLIPFIAGKWRNVIWLVYIMISLMTFFVYPEYYLGLMNGELRVIIVLFLRNAVLIGTALLIAWDSKTLQPISSKGSEKLIYAGKDINV